FLRVAAPVRSPHAFPTRRSSDLHVLEGLTVALANIDEMIELIKTSENPQVAKERMLGRTWEPGLVGALLAATGAEASRPDDLPADRKSTRLNSSHVKISYAVLCL